MYLVKNHHEGIITRKQFNRVQEEMARRSSKRRVADKYCKTEQGKYSAKFALSEMLICGECGAHYRRVTWTAKGYKEIKWRCINRLQYLNDHPHIKQGKRNIRPCCRNRPWRCQTGYNG
ncbi:MAG: recombinase zinc beta ribbon domain-containing protein [Ruminiclostridium sp.]